MDKPTKLSPLDWEHFDLSQEQLLLLLSCHGRHGRKKNLWTSIYHIYLHEWLILMVNVDKYTIHGSYGCQKRSIDHVEPPVFRSSDLNQLTTLVSDSTSSVPSMTPDFFPSGVKSKLGMFHKKSRKFWRNRGN